MQKDVVRIVWIKSGDGGQWHLAVNKGFGKPPGQYDKVKVARDQHSEITFIINNVSKGVKFDPAKPIEFTRNNQPLTADEQAQFAWTIDPGGDLVVTDYNFVAAPTEYYYQLNFVGAPPLDPVIVNGCCAPRPLASEQVLVGTADGVLAGFACSAILIALLALRTRRAHA